MRRLGRVSGLSALLCAFVAAACGSDDDSGGPNTEFWKKYGEIYCPGAKPCCDAHGQPHDVGACRDFYGLLGGYASSGKKYDAAAADQCLSELQVAMEACVATGFSEPPSCQQVFSGSKKLGESCNVNYDCALSDKGTVGCHHDSSGGKCKVELPPAEGQPCGSDSDTATEVYECELADDFYCDNATDTCKKRVALGGACPNNEQCVSDATCTNDVCAPKAAVGEACTVSGLCVSTAYCDSTTQKCATKKALGESCTSGNECEGFSCPDGKCGGGGASVCITEG